MYSPQALPMPTPRLISIQPGQPGEGLKYNVMKPIPYPLNVRHDGTVEVGPQTDNEEWKLLGFQPRVNIQTLVLSREQFMADPIKALRLVPVFVDRGGNLFNLDTRIVRVTQWFSDGSSLPYEVNENDEEN